MADPQQRELDRIREQYVASDGSRKYGQQFLPFNRLEFGYHIQQLSHFGAAMREAGFQTLEGLNILDVGCGTGRFLGDLIGLGANCDRLAGVDLMENRIQTAREKLPQINFRVTNGRSLPFDDRSFDLVTQNVVFSSIGSKELRVETAKEMLRVLKPGGYVWWWDMPRTVSAAGGESLNCAKLFPGMRVRHQQAAYLPRPSHGVAKRRWRLLLGGIFDIFSARTTHDAILLGPKNDVRKA